MPRPVAGVISTRHASSAAFADPAVVLDDAGGVQSETDETCPVCKTTRYFNKDMEFRINPECYHRMCKTCVERIFREGPNQCPYAGCHKTLRLRGFRSAFFSDLTVEREVDIRRRVAAVFNKVEDDFETLDDYNDYLYTVECLTDDLVNGKEEEKKKAEIRLLEYEARHKAEIERNKKLARESDEARRKRLAAEEDAAWQRRIQDLQEQADEKANAQRLREEVLDTLQSTDVGHATEAMNKIMLKKRGQQKRDAAVEAATNAAATALAAGGGGISIRGLRDKKASNSAAADDPYDPYGGLDVAPSRVNLSQERLDGYQNRWVDDARISTEFVAGGYSPDEYLCRALFEAFSGLGVFVGDDPDKKAVATAAAGRSAASGQTAGRMDIDVDPF